MSMAVKLYKRFEVILLFTLVVLFNTNGLQAQAIVESPDSSDDKRTVDSECNLTDYQRQHIFTKVEIAATFKGHSEKWFEFAQNNFDFNTVVRSLPDTVHRFQDSIIVKFIVTKVGLICKVEMLKGNKILFEPVLKLFRMSPSWVPGLSAGRNLNSYRTLKIEVVVDKPKNEFKILKNWKSYSSFRW
jgi:hypothetical protein